VRFQKALGFPAIAAPDSGVENHVHIFIIN
jgi:hypothetical protein